MAVTSESEAEHGEHAPHVVAVGHRRQRRRITLAPQFMQQLDVVRVALFQEQVRVTEQSLVDPEPDPREGLPRLVGFELMHALPSRPLQPEAPHQGTGDLFTREAHQVAESREHVGLADMLGPKFDGCAGVGEGFELFRLKQGAIHIEEHGEDHLRPSRSMFHSR
jgi:hypothetical protein